MSRYKKSLANFWEFLYHKPMVINTEQPEIDSSIPPVESKTTNPQPLKATSLPTEITLGKSPREILERLAGGIKNMIHRNEKQSSVYKPEGNAVLFTTAQWKDWLQNIPEIPKSELESASLLMTTFNEGVQDTFAYHQQERNIDGIALPHIVFSNVANRVAGYVGHNTIEASIPSLLRRARLLTQHGPNWRAKAFAANDETYLMFQGTLLEESYFFGVEEEDHNVWERENPEIFLRKLPSSASPIRKDAQAHEYRALVTQTILAQKKGNHTAESAFHYRMSSVESKFGTVPSHASVV